MVHVLLLVLNPISTMTTRLCCCCQKMPINYINKSSWSHSVQIFTEWGIRPCFIFGMEIIDSWFRISEMRVNTRSRVWEQRVKWIGVQFHVDQLGLVQWVFIVEMETLWPVVPVSFLTSTAALQKECRSRLKVLKTSVLSVWEKVNLSLLRQCPFLQSDGYLEAA